MADLSITAASVIPGTGSDVQMTRGIAGAAITAGMVLYSDSANSGVLKAADANASSATATVVGIALHAAASGQPVLYQTAGTITIGATVVAGRKYCLSANAGLICIDSDLVTTGWYASYLGYATTTAILNLQIQNTGVMIA